MSINQNTNPTGTELGDVDFDQVVVRVENLKKQFRRNDGTIVPAIDDISFELRRSQFMVLLGPSGCGKTTLLRCIAGLEQPDSGRIEVEGQTVFSSEEQINVRAENRNLSMVFQSYALWPHMTVAENIAFPLKSLPRSQRPSKSEIEAKVDKIMETVGIPGLQQQHPNAISGGQQQRVALCRALIAGSGLVLFDEPLSNIDAQVREQLRLELLLMQRELQFASLFVTHDRQEAMVLAHTIAVLDKGRISQRGTPSEVYNEPENKYVASFIGPTNEWEARLTDASDPENASADTKHGVIHGQLFSTTNTSGDVVSIWRPEKGKLLLEPSESENCWKGTIEQFWFYGAQTEYLVRVDDEAVRVIMDGQNHLLRNGITVWVSIDATHVFFVSAQ